MENLVSNSSSTADNAEPSTQISLCCKEYGSNELSEGEQENANESSDSKTEEPSDKTPLEASESKSTTVNASGRPGSTSPDLPCPICLGQLENRSFTDTCFHKFCFVCLVEWSKVKAVCPLCKQPFTSVIHSVRSYDDFEQLPITGNNALGASSSSATQGHNRFRYRTTMVNGSSLRRQREQESLQRPSRYRHRGASSFNTPPAFTSSFRRSIYRDSLWVQTISGLNRYRDVSSGFFARNPACMHRLVPWLNRELMAVLRVPHDVAFMLSVIMDSIQQFDITSDFFYALISPFLGARTRHFIHEFNTFARSPFDMAAYDIRAVYARLPQTDAAGTAAPIEYIDSSDSDESSSDSDNVQIVNGESSGSSHSALSTLNQARAEKCPRSDGFLISSPQHTQLGKNNLNGARSSPVAGPSGDVELQPRVETSATDHSDDEVMVVALDKPWRERSPIVLSSSSDDEMDQSSATQINVNDSRKSMVAERLEQEISSSDDEPVFVSSVKSVVMQPPHLAKSGNNGERRTKQTVTGMNSYIHIGDPCRTSDLTEELTSSSNSKRADRSSKKDHKKDKHRHRHHHRRRQHSDNTGTKSLSSSFKPVDDDSTVSLTAFDSNSKCGISNSIDVIEHIAESGIVSENASEDKFIRRNAKSEIWVSDSSSGDEGTASNPGAIRSAVVVPGMSQFKKHSSGHKHSEL